MHVNIYSMSDGHLCAVVNLDPETKRAVVSWSDTHAIANSLARTPAIRPPGRPEDKIYLDQGEEWMRNAPLTFRAGQIKAELVED